MTEEPPDRVLSASAVVGRVQSIGRDFPRGCENDPNYPSTMSQISKAPIGLGRRMCYPLNARAYRLTGGRAGPCSEALYCRMRANSVMTPRNSMQGIVCFPIFGFHHRFPAPSVLILWLFPRLAPPKLYWCNNDALTALAFFVSRPRP